MTVRPADLALWHTEDTAGPSAGSSRGRMIAVLPYRRRVFCSTDAATSLDPVAARERFGLADDDGTRLGARRRPTSPPAGSWRLRWMSGPRVAATSTAACSWG